jgi:hypothetical protein
MNERIQELLEQAGGGYFDEDGNALSAALIGKDIEKFAELLISECVTKIENEAAQYAEPVWAFELVNDIHEHFGVK